MIAVVTLLLPRAEGGYKIVMALELLAFSLVAIALLRCVEMMGPPLRMLNTDDRDTNAIIYTREVIVRRVVYQWALRAVSLLTIILIVNVALEYLVP